MEPVGFNKLIITTQFYVIAELKMFGKESPQKQNKVQLVKKDIELELIQFIGLFFLMLSLFLNSFSENYPI